MRKNSGTRRVARAGWAEVLGMSRRRLEKAEGKRKGHVLTRDRAGRGAQADPMKVRVWGLV